MPLGQFVAGQSLVEGLATFDNFTAFNRGIKAGTGFGSPTVATGQIAVAGTGATISAQRGSDFAGAFTITAGTGPTTAGTVATVTFASPLAVTPTSVIVNVQNQTAVTALVAAPAAVSTSGFAVMTSQPALNNVLNFTYLVIQ